MATRRLSRFNSRAGCPSPWIWRVAALAATFPLALMLAPGTEGARSSPAFRTVFYVPGNLAVSSAGARTQKTWRFQVPESARPALGRSYILDARVQLMSASRGTDGATSELGILTDGYEAGMLDVTRDSYNGQPALWWSTYELFTGPAAGLVLGGKAKLHFRNYLQIRGLHVGANTLSLRLTNFHGGALRGIRLLRGSRIMYGSMGPASIRPTAALSATHARVG
jgi:hypothetical protein